MFRILTLNKLTTTRTEQKVQQFLHTAKLFRICCSLVQLLSLLPVLADNDAFVDEDEGEAFDFDSGDDIPEADHPPPEGPAPICRDNSHDSVKAGHVLPNPDPPECNTAASFADPPATSRPSAAGGGTAEEVTSAAEGCQEGFLPPPPTVISDSKQTGL